ERSEAARPRARPPRARGPRRALLARQRARAPERARARARLVRGSTDRARGPSSRTLRRRPSLARAPPVRASHPGGDRAPGHRARAARGARQHRRDRAPPGHLTQRPLLEAAQVRRASPPLVLWERSTEWTVGVTTSCTSRQSGAALVGPTGSPSGAWRPGSPRAALACPLLGKPA